MVSSFLLLGVGGDHVGSYFLVDLLEPVGGLLVEDVIDAWSILDSDGLRSTYKGDGSEEFHLVYN